MKKIFALVLALVLTAALAVTCFAATVTSVPNSSNTASVKATYAPGSTSDTIYSVDVSFGDMAFTYNDAVQGTWNPETHGYTGAVAANWTCAENANKITVTNHSNAAVDVDVTYAKAAGFEGITGTITNDSYTLVSAVDKATDDAELTEVSTLTLSGALDAGTAANTTIGTVTVTISAAA